MFLRFFPHVSQCETASPSKKEHVLEKNTFSNFTFALASWEKSLELVEKPCVFPARLPERLRRITWLNDMRRMTRWSGNTDLIYGNVWQKNWKLHHLLVLSCSYGHYHRSYIFLPISLMFSMCLTWESRRKTSVCRKHGTMAPSSASK